MKNSPKLEYALSLLVLSGTSLPLASVAAVWDYDNAKSVEQPAAGAAAPRSGLEGPIYTETMESCSLPGCRRHLRSNSGRPPQRRGSVAGLTSGPEGPAGNDYR